MTTANDIAELDDILTGFGPKRGKDGRETYSIGKSYPPIDQTRAIVLLAKIVKEHLA